MRTFIYDFIMMIDIKIIILFPLLFSFLSRTRPFTLNTKKEENQEEDFGVAAFPS